MNNALLVVEIAIDRRRYSVLYECRVESDGSGGGEKLRLLLPFKSGTFPSLVLAGKRYYRNTYSNNSTICYDTAPPSYSV